MHACKSLQLWLTLCHPTNCSLLGPFVLGILQARILEWVAMPFSRGSSRLWIELVSLTSTCTGRQVLELLGKPIDQSIYLSIYL